MKNKRLTVLFAAVCLGLLLLVSCGGDPDYYVPEKPEEGEQDPEGGEQEGKKGDDPGDSKEDGKDPDSKEKDDEGGIVTPIIPL